MKTFTALLVALLVAVPAFAGGQREEAAQPETVMIPGGNPNESPLLQRRVLDGELPPLEERLPPQPYVIPLTEENWGPSEIGQFGGTWRRAALSTQASPLGYTIGIISAKSDINWPSPKSNVGPPAGQLWTNWSYSDDLTSFTAEIRRGVKWSDGAPLTADDYVFGFRDVITNPEVGDVGGVWRIGGETVQISKIDDYTIRFDFAAPYPAFETILIQQTNTLASPKHYLAEFHPEHNTDLASGDDPYGQFIQKNAYGDLESGGQVNIDLPRLDAWVIVETNLPEYAIFERNPYFYMVDPEGNQLPYIDYIRVDLEADTEVIFLKALSGAYDYQRDQIRAEEGKDLLLVQNREAGNYYFSYEMPNTRMMRMVFLNWDTQDEKLRELIRNRDFRFALSYATNRDDINQVMYNGRAIARNHYFANLSPYYEEGWEERHAEYDPDRAMQILDELGIIDRNGDGWRQYPDGSTLVLVIDATEEVARRAHAEMVVEDWKGVGLNATVNTLTGAAFVERINAGRHDFVVDWPGPGTFFPETEGSTWGPVRGARSNHATPQMTLWFETNGRRGTRPASDDPYARVYELLSEAASEPNRERRVELYQEVGRIHINELLHLGLTSVPEPQGTEIVVSNDLSNPITGHIHDQSDRRGEVFFFNNPDRRNATPPVRR